MKTKRLKLSTREQVEKAFQSAVGAIRKIRGFVNVEIKATVRVQDADPNKAVVLVSKHAV
jgi:heme-degrading monooxygenase HmoA